ncbi:MAG: MmcQ/YjbR family DNA-binding protein [Pseudomonadota bacterium]|nr:MmcQ/YjbR family DNA-binding protein [Pseudomonadota bacterium]
MKLGDARRIALALPEAAEAPHFDFTSFRVRGKIFATAPPDGLHLHVFVDDDAREQALELHAEFIEKLWWGKKVVGLRVRLAGARTAVVRELLQGAWRRKAPKSLVAA